MEKWKGHLLHLEALSHLKDIPGWVCWIVGGAQREHEKKYFEELKAKTKELGLENNVQFLGYRNDISILLAAADVHCQPNTSPEPFGITFIEGLASGLPVVTTDMGGAREIVDSKCGVLVSADADSLAHTLKIMITNPELRQKLGANAIEKAKRFTDTKATIAQLNRLILE
jgi:glycosyltransferase involved in cell wall biosynthesis